MIDFFNANAGAVTALCTIVLALLTGGYVWLTYQLLRVNTRQTELAMGRDKEALDQSRRTLLILGNQIRSQLQGILAARNHQRLLRTATLWTSDDIRRLADLCTVISDIPLWKVFAATEFLNTVRTRILAGREAHAYYGQQEEDVGMMRGVGGAEVFFPLAELALSAIDEVLNFKGADELMRDPETQILAQQQRPPSREGG